MKNLKYIDLYKKIRKRWDANPITRVKDNKKIHNRNKIKSQTQKEIRDNVW